MNIPIPNTVPQVVQKPHPAETSSSNRSPNLPIWSSVVDVPEDGYSLEVFNVLGDTIAVIVLPESAIAPLAENEVFRVRPLAAA
jgi:hypothetical protein